MYAVCPIAVTHKEIAMTKKIQMEDIQADDTQLSKEEMKSVPGGLVAFNFRTKGNTPVRNQYPPVGTEKTPGGEKI